MEFRPKLKAIVIGVGMALCASSAMAGSWGAPSQGDSGQGVDTVIGNGLNATGLDTTRPVDTDGLGPYRSPVAHTPTGSMYSVPWQEPAEGGLHASIEAGGIITGGDNDAAKLIEYRDMRSGGIINNFSIGRDNADHSYFSVFGGGVGREDQYYGVEAGVYNNWRVRGFYNETPHVFSTTARLIWDGAGTGYLALKQPLQYTGNLAAGEQANAATVNQNIRAVVNSSPDETIKLTREKGGIRFDKNLPNNWSFYVNATSEKRTGGRTWGQTGGGFPGPLSPDNASTGANAGNGQPMQMVEPIDYRTTDIRTGLSWTSKQDALNVSLSVSLFQDAIKRVLWENPNASPYDSGVATLGATNGFANTVTDRHIQSFTTPPDNQAYYLKVDHKHNFGKDLWNAKLNSSLSYGIQNQNDALQPYTSVTGGSIQGAATGVGNEQNDMAYWNSMTGPNGLPTTTRSRSGLKNVVTNWVESLSLQPTKDLSLNAKFKFYDFDQHNDYLACNPSLAAAKAANLGLTNAQLNCDPASSVNYPNAAIYGYMIEDAGIQAFAGFGLAPTVGSTTSGAGVGGAVRSLRSTFRTYNSSIGGDYRLSKTQSISLNIEEENVWRKERERERTDEAKIKLGYVNRDLGGGTLRASYEYDDRGGTDWKVGTYMYSECPAFEINFAACAVNAAGGVATGGIVAPAATANPPDGGKHDLNDRKQNIVILRYNKALTDTFDFMVTGRSKMSSYPNPGVIDIGLDSRRENTLSLDLNWQASQATALYGYATVQQAKQGQRSIDGYYSNCTTVITACSAVIGGSNSIFGALTNASAFFHYGSEDKNAVVGIGFSHAAAAVRFDGNYQYARTRTSIDFNRWNNTITGPATTVAAFNFPDMQYDRQQLNLGVTVPVDSNLAVRGMYMYDRANIADWHYDGLGAVSNTTGDGRYYVDGGPAQSYKAQTLGLMLQYKM